MNYNNNWLIKKYQQDERIQFLFFWGHQPAKDGSITKSCFSQWWLAPFEVGGIVYKTAEHWMMAEKARLFNDNAALEQIIEAKTPAEAKNGGRQIKNFVAEIWDKEKFDIVVRGNAYKFTKHPELKTFLLGTKDRVLAEASPVDNIWGIGLEASSPVVENPSAWKGENLLGYALMEVRDQLRRIA